MWVSHRTRLGPAVSSQDRPLGFEVHVTVEEMVLLRIAVRREIEHQREVLKREHRRLAMGEFSPEEVEEAEDTIGEAQRLLAKLERAKSVVVPPELRLLE